MPRAGSLEAVQGLATEARSRSLQRAQLNVFVARVSALVALMALLMWLRNPKERSQRMLLWLAMAMAFPLALHLIVFAGDQVSFKAGVCVDWTGGGLQRPGGLAVADCAAGVRRPSSIGCAGPGSSE